MGPVRHQRKGVLLKRLLKVWNDVRPGGSLKFIAPAARFNSFMCAHLAVPKVGWHAAGSLWCTHEGCSGRGSQRPSIRMFWQICHPIFASSNLLVPQIPNPYLYPASCFTHRDTCLWTYPYTLCHHTILALMAHRGDGPLVLAQARVHEPGQGEGMGQIQPGR